MRVHFLSVMVNTVNDCACTDRLDFGARNNAKQATGVQIRMFVGRKMQAQPASMRERCSLDAGYHSDLRSFPV